MYFKEHLVVSEPVGLNILKPIKVFYDLLNNEKLFENVWQVFFRLKTVENFVAFKCQEKIWTVWNNAVFLI